MGAKRKAATTQLVRFRVDFSPRCSIGPGKIELLESIEQHGSLKQAARALGMSYRFAWFLLNDLNRSFGEAPTTISIGGYRRGGVTLTPFGKEIIRCYRSAARAIEASLQSQLEPIARKAVARTSQNRDGAPRKRLSRGISAMVW